MTRTTALALAALRGQPLRRPVESHGEMTANQRTVALSALWLVALGGGSAMAEGDAPGPRSAGEARVEGNREDDCEGECAEPEGEARRPGWFQVGAGFSSDESFIASAAVGNDNLLATGTALDLRARLSAREQLFRLRFADPRLWGDLGAAVELHDHQQSWFGFGRRATGGALTLSRPLSESTSAHLGYRLEHIGIDVDLDPELARRSLDASPADRLPELARGGLLSSVRAAIVHDTAPGRFYPPVGTSAGAYLELADPRLGSEIALVRYGAWVRRHQPLLGPLVLHLGAGIDRVSSLDDRGVPLPERLQLGGMGDVRGHAPGAAGPRSASGIPLGGNLKWVVRGELELPIARKLGLSAAVFFDAGNVLDLESPGDRAILGGVKSSVGAGLIWRTPFGPLRIGVAVPLDRSSDDRGFEIVFSLGGDL